MVFCLTKDKSQEFLKKIKSREIDIYKLIDMSSAGRREFFMNNLKFDEATAKEVNALFESKLLLKYQTTGFKNWIEKTGGLKVDVKRDLLSKVQRMNKILNPEDVFLDDLVEKRLGIENVSEQQAKQIYEFSKEVEKSKALIKEDMPIGSPERLDYGMNLVQFQEYVKSLKREAQKKTVGHYTTHPNEVLYKAGGTFKSMLSTFDNSFYGRQAIKVLFTKPNIWIPDFLKSWRDIGRQLIAKSPKNSILKILGSGDDAAMNLIKADVYSRPNALNGRYEKMKLDIGLVGEEAFPESLPEHIPLIGRLFKASEVAFNGGAMRMRADLADRYMKNAEKNGVDIDNKAEIDGLGKLVNATTGRGGIGVLEPASKQINALMFSVKFVKSNFDTLIGGVVNILKYPLKHKTMTFAEKQAAKNLLYIIGSIATILGTAKVLNPDSTDLDSRSGLFGKIRFKRQGKKDVVIDITGGMSSIVILASRLTPTIHNGKWGFWQKSASTGKWTNLTAGKYGQTNALDALVNFGTGKLSPLAGLVRDIWKGQNYDREKVTIESAIKSLTLPISVQQFEDFMESNEDAEKILMYMILEGTGFSTSIYK